MWTNFKKWWASPFQPGMSVVGWFLFFGLVVVISGLWGIIFSHLKEA